MKWMQIALAALLVLALNARRAMGAHTEQALSFSVIAYFQNPTNADKVITKVFTSANIVSAIASASGATNLIGGKLLRYVNSNDVELIVIRPRAITHGTNTDVSSFFANINNNFALTDTNQLLVAEFPASFVDTAATPVQSFAVGVGVSNVPVQIAQTNTPPAFTNVISASTSVHRGSGTNATTTNIVTVTRTQIVTPSTTTNFTKLRITNAPALGVLLPTNGLVSFGFHSVGLNTDTLQFGLSGTGTAVGHKVRRLGFTNMVESLSSRVSGLVTNAFTITNATFSTNIANVTNGLLVSYKSVITTNFVLSVTNLVGPANGTFVTGAPSLSTNDQLNSF